MAARNGTRNGAVSLLPLQQVSTWTKDGVTRSLKDYDGYASEKQVMALYKRGRLAVVAEPIKPFTKGEASFAMEATAGDRR